MWKRFQEARKSFQHENFVLTICNVVDLYDA